MVGRGIDPLAVPAEGGLCPLAECFAECWTLGYLQREAELWRGQQVEQ